jgi:hypothetical protein
MPRRPKREEGMEQPKRARRRKPETAKANLDPPLKQLWRTGCLLKLHSPLFVIVRVNAGNLGIHALRYS